MAPKKKGKQAETSTNTTRSKRARSPSPEEESEETNAANNTMEKVREKAKALPIVWEKTFEKGMANNSVLKEYAAQGRHQVWQKIMDMDVQGYTDMVREFYIQLVDSDTENVVKIRGKRIPFTSDTLEDVFELYGLGQMDCPVFDEEEQMDWDYIGQKILKEGEVFGVDSRGKRHLMYNQVKLPLRPWFHFLCYTIFGVSNRSETGEVGARILACIADKSPFDLPKLIVDNVLKFKKSPLKATALRYPTLISALCLHYEVPTKGERLLIPTGVPRLTASTVTTMINEDKEIPDRVAQPRSALSGALARVDALTRAVSDLGESLRQEREENARFRAQMLAYISGHPQPPPQ